MHVIVPVKKLVNFDGLFEATTTYVLNIITDFPSPVVDYFPSNDVEEDICFLLNKRISYFTLKPQSSYFDKMPTDIGCVCPY